MGSSLWFLRVLSEILVPAIARGFDKLKFTCASKSEKRLAANWFNHGFCCQPVCLTPWLAGPPNNNCLRVRWMKDRTSWLSSPAENNRFAHPTFSVSSLQVSNFFGISHLAGTVQQWNCGSRNKKEERNSVCNSWSAEAEWWMMSWCKNICLVLRGRKWHKRFSDFNLMQKQVFSRPEPSSFHRWQTL